MPIAPLTCMTGRPGSKAIAALVGLFIGLTASHANSQLPQLDEATVAREQKARDVTPHKRSTIERALFKLEDDLLLERVFDPPRGIYLRLGSLGEGSGFALGPAFRYNTSKVDFKASAAASTKTYFTGEASLRFPGTVGQDEYFKSQGPYVELHGRRRAFPQEDFFGLGPDSRLSNRSDFALRDTLGRITGGYDRGRLQAGIGLGYLDTSIGTGTDARMPASTEIFSIDAMPGVSDRVGLVLIEPFVEYASIDPAIEDHSGGRYRLSLTEYQDHKHDRYSFRRWEADLRQYLPFVKDTRMIAVRAWASSTSADAGNEVPFYLQPTLGGGRTLRGYHTFRFRDRTAVLLQGEYRWRINHFVQGALFYDTGTVGSAIDELGTFERSYGLGLRAGGRSGSAFRVEMAFGGREGTRLLVRFNDAF
jgi:hypothetical protein